MDTPSTIKIANHITIDHDQKKNGLQDNTDPIYKSGVKVKMMHTCSENS